jgi:hypothetical protein
VKRTKETSATKEKRGGCDVACFDQKVRAESWWKEREERRRKEVEVDWMKPLEETKKSSRKLSHARKKG